MAASNMLRLSQGFSTLKIHATSWSCIQRNVSSKKLLENLGLPEKPKKPLPPFFIFRNIIKSEIQNSQGDCSVIDISKLASARWKECDPKEKEKLFEMYRKDYETYKENMLQYEKLLSKEQKNQIKDVKENYRVHRENQILKKDVRRKLKELNKPRRPAAAFFLYIREMQKRESETHKDFIARMSKEWENLPISSKKKFIEEWEMKTKEYNKELLEWEEEMIQKGNVDVVRSTTLKSKMEASN